MEYRMHESTNGIASILTLQFHAMLSRAAPILKWSCLGLSYQFSGPTTARISRSSSHFYLDYVFEHGEEVSSRGFLSLQIQAPTTHNQATLWEFNFPCVFHRSHLSHMSVKFRHSYPNQEEADSDEELTLSLFYLSPITVRSFIQTFAQPKMGKLTDWLSQFQQRLQFRF